MPVKRHAVPLLGHSERRRIEQEIASDELYLRGMNRTPTGEGEAHLPHSQGGRPVDVTNIQKRIARNRSALERMSPVNRKLRGRARDKAFKEMREHEVWLKDHMLTTWDMGAFPSATDPEKDHKYRMAVEKAKKQEVGSREFQQRSSRFKELARLLEPEDPDLPNIERLRSTKRY